jgi:hypothetical protein
MPPDTILLHSMSLSALYWLWCFRLPSELRAMSHETPARLCFHTVETLSSAGIVAAAASFHPEAAPREE